MVTMMMMSGLTFMTGMMILIMVLSDDRIDEDIDDDATDDTVDDDDDDDDDADNDGRGNLYLYPIKAQRSRTLSGHEWLS